MEKIKKLLVLGATEIIGEIVKEAKKKGYYVITVDYYAQSPAKKISDESLFMSATDINKISDYIQKNKIDGVLTGFTDSLLMAYYQICIQNNLPCNINKKQYILSTDKLEFKNMCKKYQLPIIEEYSDDKQVIFPVIVKPIDNSGAKGISVCYNQKDLINGIEIAKSNSTSKKYIVEDYLDYNEATVFYIFIKGKPYLVAMGDRHVHSFKEKCLKLPTGYTFPSKALAKFVEEENDKFINLFKDLNCQNGMVFIQGFVDDNLTFIPYECGFRLTGSLEYKLIEYIHGYNPLSMLIDYAVSGDMLYNKSMPYINPFFSKKLYNLSCLIKPGYIQKIIGLDKIEEHNNILYYFLSYKEHTEIPYSSWGKLSQIFIRIFFVAESESEYKKISDFIKNNLSVVDQNNDEMLLNKEIIK